MNYNNLSLDSALSREFSKMGMTVKGLICFWYIICFAIIILILTDAAFYFFNNHAVRRTHATYIFQDEDDKIHWTQTVKYLFSEHEESCPKRNQLKVFGTCELTLQSCSTLPLSIHDLAKN